jgi:EAL domain-containing protein (putative c-di-GMP-specific phosphodiesterase class I)
LARAEVLTRWLHPEMGLLPPSQYIQIARDSRLAATLDAWVLRKAIETSLQLAEHGEGIQLHVNISAPSDAVLDAASAFPNYQSAAALIAVELHEATVASAWEASKGFIERCNHLGIAVGIDGFGSVGIPLPRLAALSIDFIKLGRDLTAQIAGRSVTPAIEIAIATAQHFGWSVVAEGVQNDAQRVRLTEAGAHYLQGYYIAHPLTLVDFKTWRAGRS